MLARYNSTCIGCGEFIKANVDYIDKKDGKWLHEKCLNNKKKDEIYVEDVICNGCEAGTDCDAAHTCNINVDIKNYCFECGEEINITRQLCGKYICYNSEC